jgi:DNA polymerase elongation subunit (family B)
MLVDYEFKAGKLVLSYVDETGNVKLKHYNWRNPKKFVVTDEYDPEADKNFKTWNGRKVKNVYTNNPNRYSIYEFLDSLPQEEQDIIHAFNQPKIFYIDIETKIVDSGFVEPKDATAPIQSIAIVNENKIILMGYKRLSKDDLQWIKEETNRTFDKLGLKFDFIKYFYFGDYDKPEYEMMQYLFTKLIPRMPVITGWNFVNYDWVYMVNRARRVGVDPTQSSFTRNLVKAWKGEEEMPKHRVIVDYMELYKKWDTKIKVKESNSLDFVAEKTLGINKIAYTGSLQSLYEKDFRGYLFYNAVDTILVQEIHKKMKYIDIMLAISSLAKIPILDAASTLRVTEGVLREDYRDKKGIVIAKEYDKDPSSENVLGGFVKDPNKGMNRWVSCYDFASLYPTTQRQNNIAPENFKGVKVSNILAEYDGRREKIEEDDIICANGAVFDKKF